MKLDEMIKQLTDLHQEIGNVDVLITDGYNAYSYAGNYEIGTFIDLDDKVYVDIGIGGCYE